MHNLGRSILKIEYKKYTDEIAAWDEFLSAVQEHVYTYKKFVEIIYQSETEIDKSKAKGVVNRMKFIITRVNSRVVLPFIDMSAKIGKVPIDVYNYYNTFQAEWNELSKKLKKTSEVYLDMKIDESGMLAPKLGVEKVLRTKEFREYLSKTISEMKKRGYDEVMKERGW